MKRRNEDRTGRVNKKRNLLLEKLRHSRQTGSKYELEIEEDPSIYKYGDDPDYQDELEGRSSSWLVDDNELEIQTAQSQQDFKKGKTTHRQNPPVGHLSSMFIRKSKQTNTQKNSTLEEIDDDPVLKDLLKSITLDSPTISTNDSKEMSISIIPPRIEKVQNTCYSIPRSSAVETFATKIESSTITEPINPSIEIKESEVSEKQEILPDQNNLKNEFSCPSFDLSELSNECADIETHLLDQSLKFSVHSEDISTNKSINFDIFNVIKTIDGKEMLEFFMLDICDAKESPNTVYLFGKIPNGDKYSSCMIHIKNIKNQFFVLPRPYLISTDGSERKENSFIDVYNEISKILEQHGIMKFECRTSQRLYPFFQNETPHIPYDFLEVLCMNGNKLNISEGKTFSHVFCLKRSLSEYLILKLKLKGPCWLRIIDPKINESKKSHCKFEVCVDAPESIELNLERSDPPTLVATSLSIITNTSANNRQIIGASLITSNLSMVSKSKIDASSVKSTICIICPPHGSSGIPVDFIKYSNSKNVSVDVTTHDRSLLTLLFSKISQIDPDVLISHDVFEYTLKTILHSSTMHKMNSWSMLGRLKQTGMASNIKAFSGTPVYVGRLVVELKSIAEELIKLSSYDLSELCKNLLNIERKSLDWVDLKHYFTQSALLLNLIKNMMNDSFYCLKLANELNVLPLFMQISSICGHPMSRSMILGRAERIEYLLLHSYTENGCICPDKQKKSTTKVQDKSTNLVEEDTRNNRKAAYEGGLVIDPKSGFYPSIIILLDYMSLYPSLIQEFNVCFTSMKFVSNNNDTIVVPIELGGGQAVLPREIRKLVDKRRQVKALMQESKPASDEFIKYEIRQRALKLIANSIYGCLGYVNSRFYAKPLASIITYKGRELLGCTKDAVENMGYEVIYGDTDSIMVNTNAFDISAAKEIAQKIITSINKNYKNLKIELDGIYQPMLLFKKKKYAAISITINPDGSLIEKKELKGLDIVRHDWSYIAKESGELILDLILSHKNHEKLMENVHECLSDLVNKLNSNQINTDKFVIKKKLTRKLTEYVDLKNQPHLLVAQRLIGEGKKITVGDIIEYVICIDASDKPYTQRAYHPSEVARDGYLIDIKYYMECQILPVISRLCNHIEGLESDVISRLLGISCKPLSVQPQSLPFIDENIEALKYKCHECSFEQNFELIRVKDNSLESGLRCVNCLEDINFKKITNEIDRSIFRYCNYYYKNTLICSDYACSQDTNCLCLSDFTSNYQCRCRKGHLKQKYAANKLFNQIEYLKKSFDIEDIKSKYSSYQKINELVTDIDKKLNSKTYQDDLKYIKNKLDYVSDNNAFAYVDLSEIFQNCLI